MLEERIKYLIYKFLSQSLTEEESQELDNFLRSHPALPQLQEQLEDKESLDKAIQKLASIDTQKNLDKVLARIHSQQDPRKRIIRMVARSGMAAAIIVCVAGVYFLKSKHEPDKQVKIVSSNIPEYIPPGRDRAILTLANGKELNLDSVSIGIMVNEDGTKFMKKDIGTVTYKALTLPSQQQTGKTDSNTLTTPRAGTYIVILADGTKVWLNNASSLHYPTVFTGKSREVELTGEAYFEVVKNVRQPFYIHTVVNGKKQTVEVLGTSFNISAYSDEKEICTTLETGKVRVTYKGQSRVLDSSRRVIISGEKSLQYVKEDPEKAFAWKRGIFNFSFDNLSDVMRQLSRWYNIDVKISDDIVSRKYSATIPRSNDLSSTLEILSEDKDKKYFHYSLKGNQLFITR